MLSGRFGGGRLLLYRGPVPLKILLDVPSLHRNGLTNLRFGLFLYRGTPQRRRHITSFLIFNSNSITGGYQRRSGKFQRVLLRDIRVNQMLNDRTTCKYDLTFVALFLLLDTGIDEPKASVTFLLYIGDIKDTFMN